MLTLSKDSFNVAYPDMVHAVMHRGTAVGPRGTRTKEIHPAIIEVAYPRERLVTASNRPVNVAFALAEVLWILSGRSDVGMLEFYNSNIAQFSDNGSTFNAAYGYRLRTQYGHDQIEDVIRTLIDDPDSRQATLVTTHPQYDRGWDEILNDDMSGTEIVKHVTKDRACNVLSHLMIREGRLDWLQVVRSNDLIWGTPYNWMQFTHLQEYIACRLGVPVGKYTHVVDSLHVYDHHWDEANRITEFDLYHHLGAEHLRMDTPDPLPKAVLDLEAEVRAGTLTLAANSGSAYWNSVLVILMAHAAYVRREDPEEVYNLLSLGDPIYARAQTRFYFANRWKQPQYSGLARRIREEEQPMVAEWILGGQV